MITLTDFNAVPDARELRDVSMTASSNVLNSASADFTLNDEGKSIVVGGAGVSGTKLSSTIETWVSESQVLLTTAASTTVTTGGAVFGTDCATALNNALTSLVNSKGGKLLIDGLFFLASPVSVSSGGETSGVDFEIVGESSATGIWIGVPSTSDAISLSSGRISISKVNFIGVPGASRDARRVLNLATTSTYLNCGFYGLMGTEAIVYSDESYLKTIDCLFGGCFVAGNNGYVNCVVENKDWSGYEDNDSQFVDYGYFRGAYYSKSGFSGTLGWIRADTPSTATGTRAASVFRMRGTRLDEGSLYGIVVKPTTGTIQHVYLEGIRHNVTGADTGRGIQCYNAQSVVIEQSSYGWAPDPALIGHFQDCGTVLLDSLKLTESVNGLSATNVTSLVLKDTSGVTSFTFSNVNFRFVNSRYADVSLVKNGAVSDADFPVPPAAGTLAFDETNNRLYLKRLGWVYFSMDGGDPFGPELVVNGTFTTDTTGWTPAYSAGLSVVANRLRITVASPSGGRAYQAVPTVIGQEYQVSAEIIAGTAAGLVRVGTTQGDGGLAAFSGTGGTTTFVATTTTTYVTLMANNSTSGKYCDFDNVSLRAV